MNEKNQRSNLGFQIRQSLCRDFCRSRKEKHPSQREERRLEVTSELNHELSRKKKGEEQKLYVKFYIVCARNLKKSNQLGGMFWGSMPLWSKQIYHFPSQCWDYDSEEKKIQTLGIPKKPDQGDQRKYVRFPPLTLFHTQ